MESGRLLSVIPWLRRMAVGAAALALVAPAWAAERVTLKDGFEIDCVHRVVDGDRMKLYFSWSAEREDGNYTEIAADRVVKVETIPDAPVAKAPVGVLASAVQAAEALNPTVAELHEMLAKAGAAHHVDEDLLASLVKAESGGRVKAVSRTGARGLMQLMPGTANEMGVSDAFVASENVEGGTKYLDALLTRYHDNIALAVAAYNAGPGAVDRYHGVPPFRETRAYVSRVIREFNRRKTVLMAAAK
jgi:soluble lytic murein transglycosylase-like protein